MVAFEFVFFVAAFDCYVERAGLLLRGDFSFDAGFGDGGDLGGHGAEEDLDLVYRGEGG